MAAVQPQLAQPGTSTQRAQAEASRKADVLVEALPYLQTFRDKTVVIKYGGSLMGDDVVNQGILRDIALMRTVGIRPIIVHGGGPAISRTLKSLGKEPQFLQGLRITDDETMAVAEMVLVGQTNKQIVSRLQQFGIQAVGLCGKDGLLLQAEKKYVDGLDLGWVGSVRQVNPKLLHLLLDSGMIPVIAPVGMDVQGHTYNINADEAAVAVAQALAAEKLVYLTDVPGVLADVSDPDSVISRLSVEQARQAIADGQIRGGMIPKLQSAIQTIEQGVQSVHILDGRIQHALLLEVFTRQGIGTMIQAAIQPAGTQNQIATQEQAAFVNKGSIA